MACTSENGIQMRKEIDKVKFTQVRHMPDSSKYKPKGYASWMGFWKDKMAASTRLPINDISYCYCCKKNKTDFVGGHVISKDEEKYICPICKECNDMAKEKNEYSERHFSVPSQLLVEFYPKHDADIVENQKE